MEWVSEMSERVRMILERERERVVMGLKCEWIGN